MSAGGRGLLRLALPLDYEVQPLYNLTLVAYDLGAPQRTTTSSVQVLVQDVEEYVPQFTLREYRTEVPVTLSVETVIITTQAGSPDPFIYRIIGVYA